jgi:mRNA interferase RelE/StbE
MTQPVRRYTIEIKPSALHSLSKLPPKHRAQVQSVIDALAADPRPHGVKKLEGEKTLHRIHSGVYRVLYDIHDATISIVVIRIGHRKDVYRNL